MRICENSPNFRAAQEVSTKLTTTLNVGATLAMFDGLFDGRRCAGLQNLTDHARRTGADARDPRQAPSGPSKSVSGMSNERIAAAARL
jgi:hypothetical protein